MDIISVSHQEQEGRDPDRVLTINGLKMQNLKSFKKIESRVLGGVPTKHIKVSPYTRRE